MHRRHFIGAVASVALIPALPASASAWMPGQIAKIGWDGKVFETVTGVVRGCWGLVHNPDDDDGEFWTLHHLPTGFRAGWSEEHGVMEDFSAMLDSIADFRQFDGDHRPAGQEWKDIVIRGARSVGLFPVWSQAWSRNDPQKLS